MLPRRLEIDEAVVVKLDRLDGLATTILKNIIFLDKGLHLLVKQTNITSSLLKKLNCTLETDITGKPSLVNANVAIASAVTAYARIMRR